LECPVCFESMMPPIFQCSEGHLICNVCRPKITKCPTCRKELGNIRNRALEQCVAKVLLPCSFACNGCPEKIRVRDMKKHLEVCKYRSYACPRSRSKCSWEGPIDSISDHLVNRHKMKVVETSEIDETYSNPQGIANAVWEGPILKCHGHEFILHFEQRQTGQFCAFLRFIGAKKDANRFAYSIRVERHGRSLTWTGVPRSILTSVKSVEDVQDCLVLNRDMALFFSKSEKGPNETRDLRDLRLRLVGKITEVSKSRKKKRVIIDVESGTCVKENVAEEIREDEVVWTPRRFKHVPERESRRDASSTRSAMRTLSNENRDVAISTSARQRLDAMRAVRARARTNARMERMYSRYHPRNHRI